MNLELSEKELIFLYGRLKKELNTMKNQNVVHYPKSEFQFYEDMLKKKRNWHIHLLRSFLFRFISRKYTIVCGSF